MDGGAAGGQCRQQWSSPWPQTCILPRIRNQVIAVRNGNFFVLNT